MPWLLVNSSTVPVFPLVMEDWKQTDSCFDSTLSAQIVCTQKDQDVYTLIEAPINVDNYMT